MSPHPIPSVEDLYLDVVERHNSVQEIARFFEFGHLDEPLRSISESCADLAVAILDEITDDSAELTAGLRKLLEAKDCFVRAMAVEWADRSQALETEEL